MNCNHHCSEVVFGGPALHNLLYVRESGNLLSEKKCHSTICQWQILFGLWKITLAYPSADILWNCQDKFQNELFPDKNGRQNSAVDISRMSQNLLQLVLWKFSVQFERITETCMFSCFVFLQGQCILGYVAFPFFWNLCPFSVKHY